MSKNWSTTKIEDIFKQFHSTKQGLGDFVIKENRSIYGENILNQTKKVTIFSIFISQFQSAFIYILLISALIVIFVGEFLDGFIIIGIVLLNAIIGTVQEGKARNTLGALKQAVESKAIVIRNGKPTTILDREIVPGDILLLKDGDVVTADARLLEANRLQVNESALTGESTPVVKNNVTLVDDNLQISEQNNMVFKGSYIISGLAKAVVVSTGKNTSIGQIAKKLDELQSDVPLKQNIANLSKIVIIVVAILSALIFGIGVSTGKSVIEMFVTVVAVAVSAIPESLPVVVTIVLATGVFRMSKKNALVKRLQAVEALGQAKVIALDKTGTITKNQMMVEKIFVDGTVYDVTGNGYEPKGDLLLNGEKIAPLTIESIALLGKACSFTAVAETVYDKEKDEWQRVLGDPTEVALKVFAEKIGLPKEELERQYPKAFEIPFDFNTKHHSSINRIDGQNILFSAGSPEVLLNASSTIYKNGHAISFNDEEREKVYTKLKELSNDGYRVLALAVDRNPNSNFREIEPGKMEGLTFIGFVGIIDAIRPEVSEAVRNANRAGMKVAMITGDHKETAISIAEKVGIFKVGDGVLTGKEIDELKDHELMEKLDNTRIFARVSPHHKLRIIEMYKKRKEIVAMTGDGINDALSLTAADLGVAMGKVGTEVAREAADIILLDDNFDNITAAVEEGRNIYQTIRKSVLYLLSTNFGEIFVIAVAVFLALPLPLLATQIIWLNMVTDTFLVVALSLDPKDKTLIRERFWKPSEWVVDKLMGLRILLIGTVMTAGTLILFINYLPMGYVKATTIALTVLTVFQWYNIFNIRSAKTSIFLQNPFNNKWLILGLVLAILLHLMAIYAPFMQNILHTTSLNLGDWIIVISVALSVVLVEEVRKFAFRFIK